MTLTIRFAVPSDANTILCFIRGLAEYERVPDAVRVTATEIRAQMESADPPFECLLAEYESEPAGFALFFRNYSTWTGRCGLYLEDLFVRAEYRGRGIGGALMRRLGEIAAERGWARMDWAVLDWNTNAQSFYREHGGYPLERWTGWRLDIPGHKPGGP
ncbi:MAG: GNAT family N-acetyltransferase [Deltaproteobacteria bacterium]|nr:GNAT family N-acetyltransferase [Deltaproteobacteria bacterium]